MLIPYPSGGDNLPNNRVLADHNEVPPWWQKDRKPEADPKLKNADKKLKAVKKKSMSKEEYKWHRSTVTSHYVSKMPQNLKQALVLEERLEASC
jgi:hypothetical protein